MSETRKEVAQIGFSPREEPPYGYTREVEVFEEVPNEFPRRATGPRWGLILMTVAIVTPLLFYGVPHLVADDVLDDYFRLPAEDRAERAYSDWCFARGRFAQDLELKHALAKLPFDNPTHISIFARQINAILLGHC